MLTGHITLLYCQSKVFEHLFYYSLITISALDKHKCPEWLLDQKMSWAY